MEQTQALRSALRDVPVTLLNAEGAKVLNGVFHSLDVAEREGNHRPVVVLVGPTGAGKSYVFNAIVGENASPEGVVRPTTSSVIIAGNPSETVLRLCQDAVVLPDPELPMTLVDMPWWEGSLPDAVDLIHNADLVVMVVSPVRYADATVAAVWKTLDPSRAAVILNRVTTTGDETSALLESVTGLFGMEPSVLEEAAEGSVPIATLIEELIPPSRSSAMGSIMMKAAGAGARFVVREATNAAPEIGKVAGAIDTLPECVMDTTRFDIQDSWEGTRGGIVARVETDVRDRDDVIIRSSGTPLAERVAESIGPWNGEDLVHELDLWRDQCLEEFSRAASVRWRRSNAEQLIGRFSWSTSINPAIVPPKRFTRIMGANLDGTSGRMRSVLEALVCECTDGRLTVWRKKLHELGDFQPGILASAADALDGQGPARD